MSKKELKTNAMRILDRNKIPYEYQTYDCADFIDGITAADKAGIGGEELHNRLSYGIRIATYASRIFLRFYSTHAILRLAGLRDTAGPVCAVRSIVWSVGLCGAFGCTNGDAADRFVWRGRSCGRRHDLLVCAARTTARTIAPPAGLPKRKRDCPRAPRAPAADALQCYRCQRYNGCRHRRKGHNDRE